MTYEHRVVHVFIGLTIIMESKEETARFQGFEEYQRLPYLLVILLNLLPRTNAQYACFVRKLFGHGSFLDSLDFLC